MGYGIILAFPAKAKQHAKTNERLRVWIVQVYYFMELLVQSNERV
jgi:hypothetical protein